MSCLIPRSFHKDSWKRLEPSDAYDDRMSTKSLLTTPRRSESDTQKTVKRKNSRARRSNLTPTFLGRLILNRKYEAALRRLKTTPREASIWVVGNTKHGSLQTRQLPIHIACSALLSFDDNNDPSCIQLERLVKHLALAFPGGCTHRDHKLQLPLHEALRHNAKLDTVSMLLIVAPETIDETDRYGRLPYEINCDRAGDCKEELAQILRKDKYFWISQREKFYAQSSHDFEASFIKNLFRLQCVLGGRPAEKENLDIQSHENELMPTPFADKGLRLNDQPECKISPTVSSISHSRSGESGDDSIKLQRDKSRLKALKTEYTGAQAHENLVKRIVRLEKEKSELRLRISQMLHSMKTHGSPPGAERRAHSQSHLGAPAMKAKDEVKSRKARTRELFERHSFIPKTLGAEMRRLSCHNSSRRVDMAFKERAKRDIVFVPDHYANFSNGSVPPVATTIERGHYSRNFPSRSAPSLYEHISVGAQSNLDNLLVMAEQRFGHTFSPGTIQAWQQISLPDPVEESTGDGDESSSYI
ncbi:hypothetical protein FisN_22Lh249 [Fistulifera solaris]|uniref:Uncharacterized protein n=1 Tax=Fistulifera solaris TaxID=1519565 RepID=A0A1Z5JC74_FISSO|nr:hypothetical protein FisN_22Lh249 [Fistulifera solaris]|eukprot:GAX11559.1 hypothetical protein FisN_22Lh249 [Fistulifera solaris]